MTRERALLPLLLAAAFALSAVAAGAPARAQGGAFLDNDPTVAAALTDDLIRITSRFTGARVDVFGVVNGLTPTDDVVVVVRGPAPPVRLMRKRRIFGVWINRDAVEFEGVPAFYATASTRPIDEIAPVEELARHDIGFEHAPLRPMGEDAARIIPELEQYRAAIARIKARDDLYTNVSSEPEGEGVIVYDGGLFRAQVILPPGSPTGTYRADVFVFRDGVSAARRSAELQVIKVGLERFVFDTAHQHPTLYGLFAVVFSIAAGWLAAVFYRRN